MLDLIVYSLICVASLACPPLGLLLLWLKDG